MEMPFNTVQGQFDRSPSRYCATRSIIAATTTVLE